MLFAPLLGSVASIAAQVSADTEADRILQHNAAIQSLLSQKSVQGVQKMSDDEGEKFFMGYWHFEDDAAIGNSTDGLESREQQTQVDHSTILSRSYPLKLPFGLGPQAFTNLRLSPLGRRDFECPAGTYGCSSINRPGSCCNTDETCVIVEDTGSGDVGCCPAGEDCSGTIGSCSEGYTSCPSSLGGGCCVPGYECVSGGCAHVVTVTVTIHSTTVISTSTETIAPTSTTTSTTTTTSRSTSTSTSTAQSTTGDLVPPARPTSLSITTSSSSTESVCPTGFYACSAVYQGGCCRTGRNCDTTSCPAISSTSIVTNGETIVIPEATTSAESGSGGASRCASGWFSCADTVGGGCCPSGYACGSSCTAVPSASTTGTVAKEAPSIGESGRSWEWGWGGLICSVMGMMWMML